ncbi:Sister chromatid cohesion protein [Podosphaera aphanis]|nr:Sister chromatid cohesion protein [Podosphaera aphanis]
MQILVILVDEAQSLPSGVVDIIVAQFLRASTPSSDKHTGKNNQEPDEKQLNLLIKEMPAAYNMAKTICNSCSDKMARYISQYFNEVIIEVSNEASGINRHRKNDATTDSEEDDSPVGPSEADMKELKKAHNLLRELWRASPSVLQNAIPQLEHELSADDVQLRLIATETLGDIISGIGAAGPPPPPRVDAAAYPPTKLDDDFQSSISRSVLTTPISPQSFAQTHSNVYRSFLSRKNDKSPTIRAGWATAVGRILMTSAGGIGLSGNEEKNYVKGLAEKLTDSDEKVRLAAVKAVGGFSFRDIMSKLAPSGSVNNSGSFLSSLTDRARDRKHLVRAEAMKLICRTWGVATGEILSGNERVIEALGSIPSKVFDVYYANDPEINVLLDHSMFEQLIPLTYALSKTKLMKNVNSSQGNKNGSIDVDKIRTERILLLVNSLDTKSKKAFFAMQARQPSFAKVLETYLSCCEEYNGGVVEGKLHEVKSKLDLPIKWFAKLLPDPARVNHDLHKFAKIHDRRSYQLLRFAIDPKSDFATVHKAIKEFTKRIQTNPGAPAGLIETFYPIIYRSACLIYNRSNQPIFSQYAKTNEHGFGTTANTIMQEISEKHPEIFQASLKELCKLIEANSPSETKRNDAAIVETLKSLASFAKSGTNKIPEDKNFIEALLNFSLYGTPCKTAKYALIILATSTDRKEMHMNDLLDKCLREWNYENENSLTILATINQLTIMAPSITEESNEKIQEISLEILSQVITDGSNIEQEWQDDSDLDKECQAKCLATKILVSRLRSIQNNVTEATALAVSILKLLNSLIEKNGEISKRGTTPKHHRSRLRLLAAQQTLKLCTIEIFDKILAPREFYNLCYVAQDPLEDVRRRFIGKLQKYLVKNLLPNRFLTIIFITAFEPAQRFRDSIMTWIRSRVKVAQETKKGIFEAIFPRLIHLLAHHPDYSSTPDELLDHAKYILYYISTVSSEDNLPLIYKYAQRVKQARDGLPGADSNRLYVLSDLAQALIRKWEEKKGWSMQSWPKQVGLPIGLFAGLSSHEVAQEIANKIYIAEELDSLLDGLVREVDRKKLKRKLEEPSSSSTGKKSKHEKQPRTLAPKKERPVKEKRTPKRRNERQLAVSPSSERRRSGRSTNERKIYEERDSSEDDEEMWEGVAEWDYMSGDELPDENKKKKKRTA